MLSSLEKRRHLGRRSLKLCYFLMEMWHRGWSSYKCVITDGSSIISKTIDRSHPWPVLKFYYSSHWSSGYQIVLLIRFYLRWSTVNSCQHILTLCRYSLSAAQAVPLLWCCLWTTQAVIIPLSTTAGWGENSNLTQVKLHWIIHTYLPTWDLNHKQAFNSSRLSAQIRNKQLSSPPLNGWVNSEV